MIADAAATGMVECRARFARRDWLVETIAPRSPGLCVQSTIQNTPRDAS